MGRKEGAHQGIREVAEAEQGAAPGFTPSGSPASQGATSEEEPALVIVPEGVQERQRLAMQVCDANILVSFAGLSGGPAFDVLSWRRSLHTIQFLRLCGYSTEEVCSVLAHASVYMLDVLAKCGNRMTPAESSSIMVALVYIAHCYVLDETCPLSYWHRHLCRDYCQLKHFDAAVLRLMALRRYILRVDGANLQQRYALLCASATAVPRAASHTT